VILLRLSGLSSEVLASKGHIYPATINDVRLVAELEDGSIAQGETQITASLSKIRSLRLEPEQCLPSLTHWPRLEMPM
jgi:2-phospho-L-lactate transferase/gluconeogenesis factor (CofD/UPF0052 family)